MEHQLWKLIIGILSTLDHRHSAHQRFSDCDIVAVYYWAVLHDRPISWAVQSRNWPIHLRARCLPSQTTMSRRLRSHPVQTLLNALERRVIAPTGAGLFWIIDGKSLPIGGASQDRQAGYGRAANCMAKGYKVHVILNSQGQIATWRLAPMNKDERVMATRMLPCAGIAGYLVADSNYDSNPLHAVCDRLGNLQLIARRRHGAHRGLGRHRHEPGRLRSVERTENPFPQFADELLRNRDAIERMLGNLTSWGGGLGPLPAWVRTHRRVRRWVQAKLVINHMRNCC